MSPSSIASQQERFSSHTETRRLQWPMLLLILTAPLWGSLYGYLGMWLHSEVLAPLFGWPDWFPEATRLAFREWLGQGRAVLFLPQG